MILHCDLNKKPNVKSKKYLRVEYIFNGGYWAKWYEAKNYAEAKECFLNDYKNNNAVYLRTKSY